MYKVKIITYFSSAHYLKNYKGKCENLHGHNWKVEVLAGSSKLDKSGMVVDFNRLKELTNLVLEKLDHKNLNDLEFFKTNNPSSELIAKYIFLQLKKIARKSNFKILQVSVWETENSSAIYEE